MDYQGLTQKLLKGSSKKTLYYVAVIPVNPMGQVLVGERKSDGIWTTPGGGANEGESPEQAAIREAWEEAGLVITPSMLESMSVKTSPNGKPVHCFLVRTNQTNFTVKMDPDKEVSSWNWYSRENLPDGLSRQKNANRLETISQALMKFFGLSKADKIPGGLADKKKPKDFDQKALAQGVKVEMEHTDDEKIAKEIAMDHLTEDSEYYKKLKTIEKSTTESLIEKLNKGGKGSGIRGHHTVKDQGVHRNKKTGKMVPTEQFYDETARGLVNHSGFSDVPGSFMSMKQVAEAVSEETGWYGQVAFDIAKELRRRGRIKLVGKVFVTMKKSEEIEKGGPGSGVQGHMTARKPSPLHSPVKAAVAAPINKLHAHLQALEHGAVVPGIQTKSGKPVVNDMDTAKAHGYDVQDHIDAMNAHFELAQKTQQTIDKLKMAGHKVPEEGAKIAKFHEKKMKEHMKARQYLEERKKHTAEAIKEKKADAVASVKKSTTQMGGGLGDRDLDISAYAQAHSKAHGEWLEKLYNGMQDYSFGDTPRSFDCEKGTIHLSKVDDGVYSGVFTNKENGLEDNARVRIERITLPELVQLMTAKEWISPIFDGEIKPEAPNVVAKDGFNEGVMPAMFSETAPQQEPSPMTDLSMIGLTEKLQKQPEDPIDRKIQLLTLIDKLIN